MPYNPKHCTILVVNNDGSGFARQYSTLSEAKEAYNQISDGEGRSVYLYPPATKSISFEPAGSPPPLSNSSNEVVEDGVNRKPFSFTLAQNIQWNPFEGSGMPVEKTECEIITTMDYAGNTFTGPFLPKIRKVGGEEGNPFNPPFAYGDIGTLGCNLPSGFVKRDWNGGPTISSVIRFKIDAMDINGVLYGEYYGVTIRNSSLIKVLVADGNGGFSSQNRYGFIDVIDTSTPINQEGATKNYYTKISSYDEDSTPRVVSVSENGNVEEKLAGYPIQNGNYLVTYPKDMTDLSKGLASGYWNVTMIDTNGSDPETRWIPKWTFVPLNPEDPPPPENSIKKATPNPANPEENIYVFDSTYTRNPYRIRNIESEITEYLEGANVVLGSYGKNGINDGWGTEYWSETSAWEYVPNGILVHTGSTYRYYSNGQGGYYTELIEGHVECDAAGTVISSNTYPVYVNIQNNEYSVGSRTETVYADGNCGTTTDIAYSYSPSGELITSVDGITYRSNGSGGYNEFPVEGTLLSSGMSKPHYIQIAELNNQSFQDGTIEYSEYADGYGSSYQVDGSTSYYISGTLISGYYYANGAGGYYYEAPQAPAYGTLMSSTPSQISVFIAELGIVVSGGTSTLNVYADGNGGTYNEVSNAYENSGSLIYSDSSNNYYSDGNGGYYYESIGGQCSSYGSLISETTSDAYAYISELSSSYVVGSNYERIYADGYCGSYIESGTSWLASGTMIAQDSSYNYYSNGNGGYYSESNYVPCGESGLLLSENTTSAVIYINEIGSFQSAGINYERTYADGYCGSYTQTGTEWLPYGSLIYDSYSEGYYSNGYGGYYVETNVDYSEGGPDYTGDAVTPDENGSGAYESQLYEENGNPISYETYNVETGEVTFSAGQSNIPQNGDWKRNSYGQIAYTSRTPRLVTITLPNGWRTSNLKRIYGKASNPNVEATGSTTMQVQVGWIYSGRQRWRSDLGRYVADSTFVDSDKQGGTTAADIAIIPSGSYCILPQASSAGPKTLYEVVSNPNANSPSDKITFTAHNNYYVISDGNGGATLEQR